jgi:ArsR family transcriptional regulator
MESPRSSSDFCTSADCAAPEASCSTGDRSAQVRVLKALADGTRLEILALLSRKGGELCACHIEAHFDLSQPTVSHHLKVLREAGLVRAERRGTWVFFSLAREAVDGLAGELATLAG